MTDTIIAEDIELRSPDALIPYTNNPKEHPDEQVDKIASSIKNYGWDQPIVVDEDGEIIKGHGRLEAAKRLGLDEVPVIERDDLTDAEKRASRIADNKTAESDWIDSDLTLELEQLDEQGVDLELTGFDNDELDDFLNDLDESDPDGLDSEPLAEKDVEDIKILNLYAGIGGNRKLWGDADVTAVEWDENIANHYREFYPNDTVIVDNAHEYLLEHFDEYDFIWTSPPCPTHSKMRFTFHQKKHTPEYPDMKLYQEILLLEHTYDGKYVVENVEPYYDPLIEGQKRGRHLFWSNFDIPDVDIETDNVKAQDSTWQKIQQRYDYDLTDVQKSDKWKRKVLNNCVHPKLGKHILDAAIS